MRVGYVKFIFAICFCMMLGTVSGCGFDAGLNQTQSTKIEKDKTGNQQDFSGDKGETDSEQADSGSDSIKQAGDTEYESIDLLTCGDLDPEYLKLASTNYYFWIDYGDSVSINTLGQVLNAGDIRVSGIKDLITNETVFYSVYYENFKKGEDYYYSTGYTSKLYDTSGKMLLDWDEVEYQSGFDDWILSKKRVDADNDSASDEGTLINISTGERIEDVLWLDKVDDCFVVSDNEGNYVYTIDRKCNHLLDFSKIREQVGEAAYIYSYKDYIVAYNDENEDNTIVWFYAPQGRTLGYVQYVNNLYIYNSEILGSYVLIDNVIYDPSIGDGGELTPIYADGITEYYDGDLAIRSTNIGDGIVKQELVGSNSAEPLSEEFAKIYLAGDYDSNRTEQPSEYFIGVRGDRIAKLDRNGSVIAEINIPNLYSVMPYFGGIRCAVDEWATECLLDTDLNVLIPTGKYISISPADDSYDGYDSEIWVGTYCLDANQEHQRTEILTLEGKILISGLSQVEQIRNDNIGVIKGQYFGIMDLEGNWIYKKSKHEVTNMD